jgi:hypothetical protein
MRVLIGAIFSGSRVQDAALSHPKRTVGSTMTIGAAEWRVDAGRFVVIYDYPDDGDLDTVRIVSVWSKRRRKRRTIEGYPR